jgi:hypothetical protein
VVGAEAGLNLCRRHHQELHVVTGKPGDHSGKASQSASPRHLGPQNCLFSTLVSTWVGQKGSRQIQTPWCESCPGPLVQNPGGEPGCLISRPGTGRASGARLALWQRFPPPLKATEATTPSLGMLRAHL